MQHCESCQATLRTPKSKETGRCQACRGGIWDEHYPCADQVGDLEKFRGAMALPVRDSLKN